MISIQSFNTWDGSFRAVVVRKLKCESSERKSTFSFILFTTFSSMQTEKSCVTYFLPSFKIRFPSVSQSVSVRQSWGLVRKKNLIREVKKRKISCNYRKLFSFYKKKEEKKVKINFNLINSVKFRCAINKFCFDV